MLVLSRKKDQAIVISFPGCEPFKLVVVDVRGETVRLGFDAPKSVTIHRSEIHDRINAEYCAYQSGGSVQ